MGNLGNGNVLAKKPTIDSPHFTITSDSSTTTKKNSLK